MVNTELDYIKTFLGKVNTASTVMHISEARNIYSDIYGSGKTHRMHIEPGELLSVDGQFYKKRFKVKISETDEANLMIALNNIIEGIVKLNGRQPITGYTRPSVLCNIHLAYSNKAFEEQDKRWYTDVFLDIKFSTS